MDEFQVTNGTIEYSRTVRPADYEGKTPKVSLSFTVAEGSNPEAVTRQVMGIAFNLVEDTLAAKPGEPVKIEATQFTPAKRGRPPAPKPVEVVEPEKRVMSRLEDREIIALPEEVFEMVDEGDTEEEDLLGPDPTNVVKIISDADLHSQAQRTSAALKKSAGNINKLRVLINNCGGDGHLLQIPQANRHVFMEKAKGLAAS